MKSAKFSFWDYTLWPLLKIFWEPFSKKRSHFWHWQVYNGPIDLNPSKGYCAVVEKDPLVKNRRSFWANLWQTNFGWKRVALLCHTEPRPLRFHLGFYNSDKQQKEICWLILTGYTAVLKGNEDTIFFAVDADTLKQLPLDIVDSGLNKNVGDYNVI